MLQKNPGQWARIDRFLMSFSPKEKVAVLHDDDPDGLCAAAIISQLLLRLRGRSADLCIAPSKGIRNTIAPETFSVVRKKRISKLITVDLGIHEDAKAVKKLEKQCELLIIDHHAFFQDVTSERTVLAMPQLLADDIRPEHYPASKLAYDLASRHSVLDDIAWIAAAGLISDLAAGQWQDFLMRVCERHRLGCSEKNWHETSLGLVGKRIFAATSISSRNVSLCFGILMKASSPQDVLKDRRLAGFSRVFDRELARLIKGSEKMELDKKLKLAWYEIPSRHEGSSHGFSSPIATAISLNPKFRDWVIIVVERRKKQGIAKVSARCHSSRVPVNAILRLAAKGLRDADAGGHIPAAGASVRLKDIGAFRTRIIEIISKNLYTQKEQQPARGE